MRISDWSSDVCSSDLAELRRLVMETYDWFVGLVAERRQLPRDTVLKLADGRVYNGRAALNQGLIDQLGGMEEARAWLAESQAIPASLPLPDIPPEPPAGGWRGLASMAASYLFGKSLFSHRLNRKTLGAG